MLALIFAIVPCLAQAITAFPTKPDPRFTVGSLCPQTGGMRYRHSAEQLFKDKLQVKSYWLSACIPPGYACQSSGDCCGVSSCSDGVCSHHSGCTPPGGVCDSSNDCCGVSSCNDGFCDTGSGCVGEGGRCRSSGDCCGSGICPDGVCK